MDSEDDMHDAESNEDFYSGDTSDDNADGDYDFVVDQEMDDDSDEFSSRRHQQNCSILSEADICQRQKDDISRVSNVLSISRGEAGVLLRHYNWYHAASFSG
ncbi:putative E3 ubiquitin-protein ligase ARI8 [Drosera capensis]